MRHAFMYHGGLERNHPNLVSGAKSFAGTDGFVHDLPAWPESATLCFGYMEKAGKKFCVVRVRIPSRTSSSSMNWSSSRAGTSALACGSAPSPR